MILVAILYAAITAARPPYAYMEMARVVFKKVFSFVIALCRRPFEYSGIDTVTKVSRI